MRVTREDRNMIEIISAGYWIIINTDGVIVSDDETSEELARFDWRDIDRLKKYSPVAYEKAIIKFKE